MTVGQNEMHFLNLKKLGILQRALQYLLIKLGNARQSILEHGEYRNGIDQIESGQTLALLSGDFKRFSPFFDRVLVR